MEISAAKIFAYGNELPNYPLNLNAMVDEVESRLLLKNPYIRVPKGFYDDWVSAGMPGAPSRQIPSQQASGRDTSQAIVDRVLQRIEGGSSFFLSAGPSTVKPGSQEAEEDALVADLIAMIEKPLSTADHKQRSNLSEKDALVESLIGMAEDDSNAQDDNRRFFGSTKSDEDILVSELLKLAGQVENL